MANVTPDVFQVIQSYGGLKEAYFEISNCTDADVIDFSAEHVSGGKFCAMQGTDDAAVTGAIAGTNNAYVTIGSGPANSKVRGKIMWKTY
jgi:hypothetical protein